MAGESGFESWDVNAAMVNNDYIAAITDTADYFAELAASDKQVLVVKNQAPKDNELCKAFMDNLSVLVPKEVFDGNNKTALIDPENGIFASNESHNYDMGGKALAVNFEYQDIVFDGDKALWYGSSDFAVLVYDPLTDSVVDTAIFTLANGYQIYRA